MAGSTSLAKGGIGQRDTAEAVFPTCGFVPNTTTSGTDTTPAVTETYLASVFVPANTLVSGIAILNGSAVAGNIKVALADGAGNILGASASTEASGTAAYQKVPLAAPVQVKGPGRYFVILQSDNTSYRFRSIPIGIAPAGKLTSQVYGTIVTLTPPAAFTASLGPVASIY